MSSRIEQGSVGNGNAAGLLLETSAMAGPQVLVAMSVQGVEVVQSVQNLRNEVPLVADKHTVVRVYLSTPQALQLRLQGQLAVRRSGTTAWSMVPSRSPMQLGPAHVGTTHLQTCREDLDLSLNFVLPEPFCAGGNLEIRLANLQSVGSDHSLEVGRHAAVLVKFLPGARLRIHVVGIRYQSTAGGISRSHEPAAQDFALTRSWLGRAYPVNQVVWTQTVVDWPGSPPWPDPVPDRWAADQVNPYLKALRRQDLAEDTDRRTHYYGLAADSGGFMRGYASDIPSRPDPGAVASGPAGSPRGGWSWDRDASYADWYTGHELAHTLGRKHPGFCNNNSADDPSFPYPDGQIANNDGDFVGYDAGDSVFAIAPAALPGTAWHDVMTYCERQWLSSYTYKGIYERLVEEDSLGGPGDPGPGTFMTSDPQDSGGGASDSTMTTRSADPIHVVARVDVIENTASFSFVTPVRFGEIDRQDGEYSIEMELEDQSRRRYPAALQIDSCGEADDSRRAGTIDITIPGSAHAVALRLLHGNQELASFRPAGLPAVASDLRGLGGNAGASISNVDDQIRRPGIAWSVQGTASASGMNLKEATERFTVQVQLRDGRWRTVGMGLTQPEISLDPELLVGRDNIQVRVVSTNGFVSTETTQSLKVSDL